MSGGLYWGDGLLSNRGFNIVVNIVVWIIVNIVEIVSSLVRAFVTLDLVVGDWLVVMSNEGLEMNIVIDIVVRSFIAVTMVGSSVEVAFVTVIEVFVISMYRVRSLGMVNGLVVINKFVMNSLVVERFVVMLIIMMGPFAVNWLVLDNVVLRGNVRIMEGIEVHL